METPDTGEKVPIDQKTLEARWYETSNPEVKVENTLTATVMAATLQKSKQATKYGGIKR